jgi:hypothetical protein
MADISPEVHILSLLPKFDPRLEDAPMRHGIENGFRSEVYYHPACEAEISKQEFDRVIIGKEFMHDDQDVIGRKVGIATLARSQGLIGNSIYSSALTIEGLNSENPNIVVTGRGILLRYAQEGEYCEDWMERDSECILPNECEVGLLVDERGTQEKMMIFFRLQNRQDCLLIEPMWDARGNLQMEKWNFKCD